MSNEGNTMSKFMNILLRRWFKRCENAKDTPESTLFPIQTLLTKI